MHSNEAHRPDKGELVQQLLRLGGRLVGSGRVGSRLSPSQYVLL